MLKILTLISVLFPVYCYSSYLPHSLEITDYTNTKLLRDVESNIVLKNSENELVYLPHIISSSFAKKVSQNDELIKDIEIIKDSMELLKHDNFLDEIMYVRSLAYEQTVRENPEESKYFQNIYNGISKSFVRYAKKENFDLLLSFKNRTKQIFNKYNIMTSNDTRTYIEDFYSSNYLKLMHLPIVNFSLEHKTSSIEQKDSIQNLQNEYGISIRKIPNANLKMIKKTSLDGGVIASAESRNNKLSFSLNYRGYREFENDDLKKINLPYFVVSTQRVDRDLKISLFCSFDNNASEIWSSPEMTLLEDKKKYENTVKQIITKYFMQSDECNISYKNLDLEYDKELVFSVISEKINIGQLKKTGKINEKISLDRGTKKNYVLNFNPVVNF